MSKKESEFERYERMKRLEREAEKEKKKTFDFDSEDEELLRKKPGKQKQGMLKSAKKHHNSLEEDLEYEYV